MDDYWIKPVLIVYSTVYSLSYTKTVFGQSSNTCQGSFIFGNNFKTYINSFSHFFTALIDGFVFTFVSFSNSLIFSVLLLLTTSLTLLKIPVIILFNIFALLACAQIHRRLQSCMLMKDNTLSWSEKYSNEQQKSIRYPISVRMLTQKR